LIYLRKIINNIYNSGGGIGKNERIGYIRLRAEEVIKWEATPRWLHFKPIDMSKDSPGSILINLQFQIDSENNKRMFKQKGITKKYTLYAHIVQGFELDPKNTDEEIETFVDIDIDGKNKITEKKGGRYPFWNELLEIECELDWKLDFAPDVAVSLHRVKYSGIFSKEQKSDIIGNFTVPIRCIKEEKIYPHYFNFISNNEVNGRLMCMFYIEQQKKNKTNKLEHFRKIKEKLDKRIQAKISIFVLGGRNLDFDVKYDNVHFDMNITQDGNKIFTNKGENIDLKKQLANINMPQSQDMITILNLYEADDVEIYGDEDFQIFPMIKLNLKKLGIFMDDKRYIMFSVADFIDSNYVKERSKKLYKKLFEENLGVTTLDQEQRFIPEFEEVKKKKESEEEENEELRDENEDIKLINPILEEDDDDDTIKGTDVMLVNKITKYKNMDISDDIFLECNAKDKKKEKEIKKKIRKSLAEELRQLKKNELSSETEINKLLELETKIRDLKKPLMSEDIFYGFDDIGDEYDYGREVYKEDVYEFHPNMDIPYKKHKMLHIPWSPFSDKYETMGGYFKLGKETESILKFNVKVEFKDFNRKEKFKSVVKKVIKRTTINNNEDDILEEEVNLELKQYDIFNELYLNKLRNCYFTKEAKTKKGLKKDDIPINLNQIKVRVYILRCLNLTAQENHANLVDRLAGYNAFSKANAYLEILVGQNYDKDDGKGIRYINDRTSHVLNSLSPEFYKYYELDADLPEDWKLTINVKSLGDGSDGLIGSTTIDLEDRILGDLRTREIIKYKAHDEFLSKELENKNDERINKKLTYLSDKTDKLKPTEIPVEFRPLFKSDAKTAQGVIEMFVEVLPLDIAKKTKPAKIEPPPPQEYELRLVIWETRNIPLEKKVIIIF
jgi:hypothetical protein